MVRVEGGLHGREIADDDIQGLGSEVEVFRNASQTRIVCQEPLSVVR